MRERGVRATVAISRRIDVGFAQSQFGEVRTVAA